MLKTADMATGYERIKATQACLLLGENLVAAGRRTEATRVYRHLLDTRTGESEQYMRQAAEIGLAAANAGTVAGTPSENDDGWRVLFDGKDFEAWQDPRGGKPSDGWVLGRRRDGAQTPSR